MNRLTRWFIGLFDRTPVYRFVFAWKFEVGDEVKIKHTENSRAIITNIYEGTSRPRYWVRVDFFYKGLHHIGTAKCFEDDLILIRSKASSKDEVSWDE